MGGSCLHVNANCSCCSLPSSFSCCSSYSCFCLSSFLSFFCSCSEFINFTCFSSFLSFFAPAVSPTASVPAALSSVSSPPALPCSTSFPPPLPFISFVPAHPSSVSLLLIFLLLRRACCSPLSCFSSCSSLINFFSSFSSFLFCLFLLLLPHLSSASAPPSSTSCSSCFTYSCCSLLSFFSSCSSLLNFFSSSYFSYFVCLCSSSLISLSASAPALPLTSYVLVRPFCSCFTSSFLLFLVLYSSCSCFSAPPYSFSSEKYPFSFFLLRPLSSPTFPFLISTLDPSTFVLYFPFKLLPSGAIHLLHSSCIGFHSFSSIFISDDSLTFNGRKFLLAPACQAYSDPLSPALPVSASEGIYCIL